MEDKKRGPRGRAGGLEVDFREEALKEGERGSSGYAKSGQGAYANLCHKKNKPDTYSHKNDCRRSLAAHMAHIFKVRSSRQTGRQTAKVRPKKTGRKVGA
jgi:hypothetical protein